MRRRFEQALEVIPKEARKGTISYMAMKQIQAIYREEGKLKELHSKERLAHLLEEIPKHMEDTDRSFLKELLPWSDKLPKHIRK